MRLHLLAQALRNMGGVKCQPFLKHSNHWKQALKRFLKRSRALWCLFSIQSSDYGAASVLKVTYSPERGPLYDARE